MKRILVVLLLLLMSTAVFAQGVEYFDTFKMMFRIGACVSETETYDIPSNWQHKFVPTSSDMKLHVSGPGLFVGNGIELGIIKYDAEWCSIGLNLGIEMSKFPVQSARVEWWDPVLLQNVCGDLFPLYPAIEFELFHWETISFYSAVSIHYYQLHKDDYVGVDVVGGKNYSEIETYTKLGDGFTTRAEACIALNVLDMPERFGIMFGGYVEYCYPYDYLHTGITFNVIHDWRGIW